MPTCFHVTTGDIDGIGLEVTLKSLKNVYKKLTNQQLIIWLHQSQNTTLQKFLKNNIGLKNISLVKKKSLLDPLDNFKVNFESNFKRKTKILFLLHQENKPAHWFIHAVKDCLENGSSVITAPLSKTQIKSEGLNDIGHTEILKRLSRNRDLKMCFFGKYFSVVLFTDHIPVNKIKVKPPEFLSFLKSSYELHKFIKPKKSNFYILGLNPHAGDSGLIGLEDTKILKICKQVLNLDRLIPADSAFVKFKQFHSNPTFISFYHDQGLIPFKMAHGFTGFHYTMGLPFIRTSVDHGTAKDIFNQDKADAQSMTDALTAAFRLAKQRRLI